MPVRLAALLLIAGSYLQAQSDTPRATVPLDGRTAAAIDRGLDYLIRAQDSTGAWRAAIGRKVHNRYVGHEGLHVGVTALAGMSLLARLEREGATAEHRLAAARALRWICERVRADGFIAEAGSRMYSHAYATRFLARACRSELGAGRADLKAKLEKAAGLIVGTQNAEGGWRYLPGAADSDLSVTACQLVALRAARAAGVEVPEDVLRRGVDYAKGAYVEEASGAGAFRYQLPAIQKSPTTGPVIRSRQTRALTAAGLLVLAEAGESSSREARAALGSLRSPRPPPETARLRFDYYYFHHFAMSAFCFQGEKQLLEWHRTVSDEFLRLQEADGSWVDLVGPSYATAMATLVLQEPCSPARDR